MKTDQIARMHNTLSDLSTRRLLCEQTEMILKNYGKENNRGSDSCMRMQQTDSVMFYNVPYHKKIALTHKQRKLRLVGATRRNNGCCASGNSLPVRRLFKVFSS